MAITIRGSASKAVASTGTTVALPLTTAGGLSGSNAVAGDLAIVVVVVGAGVTVTMSAPSGANQRLAPTAQTSNMEVAIWDYTLLAADITTGTISFGCSAARQLSASMIILSGAAFEQSGTPSSITTGTTTTAIPQTTPTNGNGHVIAAVGGFNSQTVNVGVVLTSPSSPWALRTNGITSSSSNRDLTAIFSEQLSGGAGVQTSAVNYTSDQQVKTITTTLVYQPRDVTATPTGIVGATTFGTSSISAGSSSSASVSATGLQTTTTFGAASINRYGAQQGIYMFDAGGKPLLANAVWPIWASHQGGGNEAPPETMPAYNKTLLPSAWLALDTDVWLDASGTIIMWHDVVMSDGTTSPEAVTDATLNNYWVAWPASPGVPNPARGATWKQAADTWGGKRLLVVELKGTSIVDTPFLNDITARALVASTIVQCFTYSRAVSAAGAGFNALYLITVPNLPTTNWAQVFADGIRHVGFNYTAATSAYVNAAHAAGLRVWVFTVDTTTDRASMLALGVDGFWTNNPSTVAQPNTAPLVNGTVTGQTSAAATAAGILATTLPGTVTVATGAGPVPGGVVATTLFGAPAPKTGETVAAPAAAGTTTLGVPTVSAGTNASLTATAIQSTTTVGTATTSTGAGALAVGIQATTLIGTAVPGAGSTAAAPGIVTSALFGTTAVKTGETAAAPGLITPMTFGTPTLGAGAGAAPAAILATTTVGVAVVRTGAGAAPTAILVASTVGSATPGAGAGAAGTATLATTLIGAAQIQTSATAVATGVPGAATVGSVTISTGSAANISATGLQALTTVGTTQPAAGSTAAATGLAAATTIGQAAPRTGETAPAGSVVSTLVFGTAAVGTGAGAAATAVSATTTMGVPTVSSGSSQTATPAAILPTITFGIDAVSTGSRVTAVALATTSTLGLATAGAGIRVTTTGLVTTSLLGTPTITSSTGTSAAPTSLAATTTLPSVTVRTGAGPSPAAVQVTVTIGQANVQTGFSRDRIQLSGREQHRHLTGREAHLGFSGQLTQ